MPELAEVERCRQTINHYCVNKRIVNVHAAVDDIVYANSTSKDFESAVTGRTVLQCVRYGKHLWLEMDGAGPCAMYHMGMTGNFYIRGEGDMLHLHNETGYSVEDTWPPKYTKCELEMEDGIQVAFVNARRLGRIRLEENPLECSSLKKLGFDAFKEVPPLAQFTKMLRKRKAPVKAVLLDQSFAAGVGNWLADEILYQSQIHPQEPSDRLSDEHIMSIYTALTSVIPTAVECSADATKFPREWMFHFRWNKKDPKDYYGRKIVFVTSGGRTAAIVPEIQIQRTGAGTTGKSTTSPSKKGTKRLEKLPPGSQMVLKGERSERMCVADEGSIGRRKNLRKSKNVVDTGNRATKIETLDCSEHPAVAQTQIIPAHIHSQRKAQTQLNLLSQPHPEELISLRVKKGHLLQ
eukprot:CFRG4207T1